MTAFLIPLSLELSLQALHSRSLENFLDHVPSIKDFRFTNEALLGVMVDDNFNPMNPLQVSMGFLNGGAVVQKGIPAATGHSTASRSLYYEEHFQYGWTVHCQ